MPGSGWVVHQIDRGLSTPWVYENSPEYRNEKIAAVSICIYTNQDTLAARSEDTATSSAADTVGWEN